MKPSLYARVPPRGFATVSSTTGSDEVDEDGDTIMASAHASGDETSKSDIDSDAESEISVVDMDEYDAT